MTPRFIFVAEPDPLRPNSWRVACFRGAERYDMARGFINEARAKAWARRLNAEAKRSFPHPVVREAAEAWPSHELADGRPAG